MGGKKKKEARSKKTKEKEKHSVPTRDVLRYHLGIALSRVILRRYHSTRGPRETIPVISGHSTHRPDPYLTPLEFR